jgi:zinc D-Ala-D-Ala carboxypeptidase
MNITPHFTYDELTHTDHRKFDNTPNELEMANLKRLADLLEQVKVVLGGKPIMICL